VVRARSKKAVDEDRVDPRGGIDVNAVVSYNLRAIRERRGWTQQEVAARLARLTKHQLPQASISAMERGFDGERRRRFDAHELYLLSVVFQVPIAYFFIPPHGKGYEELADTHRPLVELYASLLGQEWQLGEMDQRLAEININNPEEADAVAAAIFGAEGAAHNWHEHYRTWRKRRIAQIAHAYADRLDDVADFLAEFANQIKAVGPRAYLQSTAHRAGEEILPFSEWITQEGIEHEDKPDESSPKGE
jgi:transcriptional regulator with XRE-family HTH domain